MGIEVVPYTAEWIEAVRAFNGRMESGGARWRWYADPADFWIPARAPGQSVWREHYLVVEDGRDVRGAYALKPHEFHCRGERVIATDWQGPITEAAVSPRYNTLLLRLLRDMLRRYPLLYSWGHGDDDQPMLRMLERTGWLLYPTPFCLRITRPARFLRKNRYLRSSSARRAALDGLAASGAGWAGLHALHVALSLRGGRVPAAEAEVVDDFGPWADELWLRCRDRYQFVAIRDAATMNVLVPRGGWPAAIRLRITRGSAVVGWALVLDTEMQGDRRFGEMRVGSIIDAFAMPEDAAAVMGAAFRFLRGRGVDMVFSNQAHPAWIQGLAANGFVILNQRRLFAASPQLASRLEPFEETRSGLHLTNMDGHGPIRL